MKKAISILLILATLGLAGYFVFNYLTGKSTVRSIYFVPKDAMYIIEAENPISSWKNIKNNPLWSHLTANNTIGELTSGLTALDELLIQNDFVFDLIGDRKVLVSTHMYTHNDYDFLYLVDLESNVTPEFLKTVMSKVIDKEIYTITTREYNENVIIELYDKEYKETLYIAVNDNVLLLSYITSLVEKGLDEYDNPKIGRDNNFLQVRSNIKDADLFNIYINYKHLDKLINLYLSDQNSIVDEICNSLFYTGLSVDLKENGSFHFDGVTNLNDTLSSFLNVLNYSGSGKNTADKVMPDITAFYLSLGFDSFGEAVQNFEKTYRENDSIGYTTYQNNNERVEKLLDINLQDHFYSWIGDEVTYMQLQSGGLGAKNEFAFILKSNDIDEAKTQLEFIKKQIKKKTPGKFKSITYNNFEINYLSIKGFFKLLLGKFFSKLEKPYYTIIEDYVVFSNHPQTLRIIIDRYQGGRTLHQNESYQQFVSQFDAENSVMCYAHFSKLYQNILELADSKTQQDLKKNKDYITCFEHVGFQLLSDDQSFITKLHSSFNNPQNIEVDQNLNFRDLKELKFNDEKHLSTDLFETLPIVINNFESKRIEDYHPNGNIKVEVELNDGQKNGMYKQYYENGELLLKGKFVNDQKDGVWKFYNSEGKVIEKRKYDEGKIID